MAKYNEMSNVDLEVSVVIPCLNEADTIGFCIEKIKDTFEKHHIKGEVIVADNNSDDDSPKIAESLGAKVITIEKKGYGQALMGGIESAKGKYIIMGDADGSYDFSEIPNFLNKLQNGYDLVLGCRLPAGGGKTLPSAMPFLHRWVGNPLFSFLTRVWFKIPINDALCGLRGFTNDLYKKLNLVCAGMEFAVELVIKSSFINAKITEIPITLHRDGRKNKKPHLNTFKDGWRTLRFLLIYSPNWLFLYPGLILFVVGMLGFIYGFISTKSDYNIEHILISFQISSFLILSGYQAIVFAILAKGYAVNESILPIDSFMKLFFKVFNLERTLIISLLSLLVGMISLSYLFYLFNSNFHTAQNLRIELLTTGTTFCVIGFQTLLFGFFASMLGLSKRHKNG